MKQPHLYDGRSRQVVLSSLETALQEDEKIAGALLVGSGATGFIDELSDLDLAVIVDDSADTLTVFRRWDATLHRILPVLWSFSDVRGPEIGLYGLLLSDFLEVDISFQSYQALSARSPNWRVLFDRTGAIVSAMQSLTSTKEEPSLDEAYFRRLDSIWHYIIHIAVCIRRGHMWRALHYLEELRNRTVELEGMLCNRRTQHFRDVDDLPKERLAGLETTLVGSMEYSEIVRAFLAAVDCWFETAARVESVCGLSKADSLRQSMKEFLHLIAL